MIRVVRPGSQALFDVAALATELGLSGADVGRLGEKAEGVCGDVAAALNRGELGRQRYRETVAGCGDTALLLSRMPLDAGAPIEIVQNGVALGDYTIDSAEAGTLYRAAGWHSATPVSVGLTERAELGQARPDIAVTYTAGWIVPGEGLRDSAGSAVRQLALAEGVAAGATTLTLEAAYLAGSIAPPWGLQIEGSDLLYVVETVAVAADNQLVVEVAAYVDQVTPAEEPGVDVTLEAGAIALPQVVYLPAAISSYARLATRMQWERESRGGAGIKTVEAGDTSITYADTSPTAVRAELNRWVVTA